MVGARRQTKGQGFAKGVQRAATTLVSEVNERSFDEERRPKILDPGPLTLDPGPSTLVPGPSTLDPGPGTPAGPRTLDPR